MDLLTGVIAGLIATAIVAVVVWWWKRAPPEARAPASPDAVPEPVVGPGDLLKSYPDVQPKWVGRGGELACLDKAWDNKPRVRIAAIVGFGGQGKSALGRKWVEERRRESGPAPRPIVVWWSFYLNKSADEFFAETLTHFGIALAEEGHPLTAEQKAEKLVELLRTGKDGRPLLLVLDGLETLQEHTPGRQGRMSDAGVKALLRGTRDDAKPRGPTSGMILVTTREALADVKRGDEERFRELVLEKLSIEDAVGLLTEQYGLDIPTDDAERFVKEVDGHALTLTLTGSLLSEAGATSASINELRDFIFSEEARVTDADVTIRTHRLPGYVLRHCIDVLTPEERQFMRLLSCCVRPASKRDIEEVFLQAIRVDGDEEALNNELVGKTHTQVLAGVVAHLRGLRLVDGNEESGFDMHPLIRRFFYQEEAGPAGLTDAQRKAVHSFFYDVLLKRQPKHHPDTLEEMQPLIDTVLHGCHAGREKEALDVYYARIGQMDTPGRSTFFVAAELGAVQTNLELLRRFFRRGDFAGEPVVSDAGGKAFLFNGAALALLDTGRPAQAAPSLERAKTANDAQSDWVNASMSCRNLSECHIALGRLPEAARAADDGLDYAGRIPSNHRRKTGYTEFSYGSLARAAALLGDDAKAKEQFDAALAHDPDGWLASLRGGWHCTWLARRAQFGRARSDGAQNFEVCKKVGDLPSQTFVRATQALVERLAWAAADPQRASLDEMTGHAVAAVAIARRSGQQFYFTYALLEAGRCAAARARHDPGCQDDAQRRVEFVAEAERYLNQAEQRAEDAEYRLILADAHVARAELGRLAGDELAMREHCRKAIEICEEPDCGYAWAKEDAERLLGG